MTELCQNIDTVAVVDAGFVEVPQSQIPVHGADRLNSHHFTLAGMLQ